MTTKPKPIVALWAVPRSVSTAFERMIMARGDFAIFHEPFSGYYYFSHNRISNRYFSVSPLPSHGYQAILDDLRATSLARPIFFKDMAYHIRSCLTPSFLALFTNTFLIRHPRHVLPSLYKLLPDFTYEEAGYSTQRRIFSLASDLQATTPIVIDADDLCRSPSLVVQEYCRAINVPFMPQALTWTAGSRPEWALWERWHLDASNSTGFYQRPAHHQDQINALPHLQAAYDYCLPFYLELYERRLRVDSNS